jgi:soluble lytic murein transglycosylase
LLIGAAALSAVLGAGAALSASAQTAPPPPPDVSGGASAPAPAMTAVSYTVRQPLSDSDSRTLSSALEAARLGDAPRVRNAMDQLSDPTARKIAEWALIETDPSGLSYAEMDGARRDLAGWPGATARLTATERTLSTSALSPQQVVDWFAGADPMTPDGAMALASADQVLGHADQAAAVIRKIWRAKPFGADMQAQMLTRFGSMLTADDHAAREDMLLYGQQGQAAHDLLPLLSPDQQALAQARMAVRAGASNAQSLIAALPQTLQTAPGLEFEQAMAYSRRNDLTDALASIPDLPEALPTAESQSRMWKLRKDLVVTALKAGDVRGAYRAAADSGCDQGQDGAEAEFYAGWIALSRLKDPKLADLHFAKLQVIGASPITLSRALYWRGKAAEAEGDALDAQLYYGQAAQYQTAFYGQLAAIKVGVTTLSIGKDPQITAADRARFEDRSEIRAARMMGDIGAQDTLKSFLLSLAETLPSAADAAQLVDLAREYGDQELSMKVVRTAAQHGYVLPERGYPVRTAPNVGGAPEEALVLGITRQESGFDPHARSGVGATGMMQLMPSTAAILARRLGLDGRLDDPDFNMELGSAYLGQLVDQFSGSYVMATAAYNAGPGRPIEWTSYCGDPRATSTDPADYIECIPISETRNYVMRVLEATQVYRARLNGGTAPLTLATDLKRGAYAGFGYVAGPAQAPPPSNAHAPATDGLAANGGGATSSQ